MSVDKIIQMKRSQRRALLLAMAVVSTVGFYRWILAPYGSQLLAAEKYNYTLGSIIRRAGLLSTTLEVKKAKLKELTAESTNLQGELFGPLEAREFFASMTSVASRAGCVIQSISSPQKQQGSSTSPSVEGSGITRKTAVVSIAGGYGSIIGFIRELQTYNRRVWIDSVRIETDGNTGRLKCQLTLTLYCADSMEISSYE
jgi:Tfp pilus assembly protein PilO